MSELRRPRALRVALVMGGAVIEERTLHEPGSLVLGGGGEASLPLPAGAIDGDVLPLIAPRADGLELLLHPAMGGAVWMDGRRVAVSELQGDRVAIGDSDYGVLTLGRVAIFFQRVGAAPRLGTGWLFDGQLIASVGLSTFLHLAVLMLLFVAQREAPVRPDLFDIDAELVRRFLVEPPPTPIEAAPSASPDEAREVDAPAPVEVEAPPVRTARPRPAAGPNVGLLRAIRGEDGRGNALAEALGGPDIGALVAGIDPGLSRSRGGGGPSLRDGGGGPGRPSLIRGPRSEGPRIGPVTRHVPRRPPPEQRLQLPPRPPATGPGWLTPNAIQRVVMRNRAAILYCYEVSLQRRPELRGRVEIAWRVELDGATANVRVASSTLGDPRAEGCMVRQVRRWRFPPPDGGVVDVRYPFLFGHG